MCSLGGSWRVKSEVKQFHMTVANEPFGVNVIFVHLLGAQIVQRSLLERRRVFGELQCVLLAPMCAVLSREWCTVMMYDCTMLTAYTNLP